jgi:putative endopeptidase
MVTSVKNKKYTKKYTKKKKNSKLISNLNDEEKTKICEKFATFDTFEDKIEKKFKDAKIDFLSTNYNLEKKILADLKKAVSPSNITPQNDFYSYVNERWLKEYDAEESKGYIVQFDNFRLIQDKVYYELIELFNKYLNTEQQSPKLQNMKKYYNSFLVWDNETENRNFAIKELEIIDNLRKDTDGLWKLLGYINKNEIINHGAPFVWSLNPDDNNPLVYKTYINPVKLTLVDIMVYIDDETDVEYKKKYKNEYLAYLNRLFKITFGEKHKFNVNDIFIVEQKLLNAMGCDIIKKENPNNYNIVDAKTILSKYEFNWEIFAKSLGYKRVPSSFITPSLNYLLCCTQLLKNEWNTEEWRTYWIYIFIRQQQRFNEKGNLNFFEFHGKFERGQQNIMNTELLPVYGVTFAFNSILQNLYIKQYNNEKYINYVRTMAEDFKTIYIRIIKRNNWLQPVTKEKAIEKLINFKFSIGSHFIPDDSIHLEYSSTNAWYNLKKVALYRHTKAISLEGKKVNPNISVIDWTIQPPKFVGTQSFLVNAFYTPTRNSITIPLAYIQKPFVDLDERGIEYNLAHVGFTIGHEMSHALDDWGSKYDANGKLNNWWTKKDNQKFQEIKNDIIKQYEYFAKRDNINYDASISIGENLADISSMTICREYLRDFQLKNEDILPIQTLSFEVFFVYFAFQYRQKISKKSIEAHLKSDPHPLDKYRCNVPLSRLPVFRTIFNVKKGDGMWWKSTNRVWE